MEEKTKYNYMENVLQYINSKYISLSEDNVKRNNMILNEVLQTLMLKMQENDALFKKLFRKIFYGGSYFDDLKVGNPEEYDLDMELELPKYSEPVITISNIPGFVKVQLKEYEKWERQPEAHSLRSLSTLLDKQHYVLTQNVSSWIEGVLAKTFKNNAFNNNFKTSYGMFNATLHKGGPAHTLKLRGVIDEEAVEMDIDLVPCFVFTQGKWPPSPFRTNPTNKQEFFIVPKKPTTDPNNNNSEIKRYWRLSFQEQERAIINNLRTFKPALKLIKLLRDKCEQKIIASYYIKTMFLREAFDTNKELWNGSLSYAFMHMLKKYYSLINEKNIPYFWNKRNNLIGQFKEVALQNVANRLKRIIDDIEKHPENHYAVATYLVDQNQLEQLKLEVPIPKSVKQCCGRDTEINNLQNQVDKLTLKLEELKNYIQEILEENEMLKSRL